MLIDVFEDGIESLAAPVLHVPEPGDGVATPLQLSFDQVVFTTNGGMTARLDNVLVTYFASMADSLPGDFNYDNVVDAADYVAWRKGLKYFFTERLSGLEISFRRQIGKRRAASVVPEPCRLALLTPVAIGLVAQSRRKVIAKRSIAK